MKQKVSHTIAAHRSKSFVILLLGLFSLCMHAQDSAPSKKIRTNKRMYIGMVIPFYSNNRDHTDETKGSFAFNIGFKKMYKLFGTGIETGLEYLNQGLSFRSYYFAPGYSKLYDKTFPFTHTLRMNEFQLPILLKQSLGKETRRKTTSYFTFGWAWRYILYSNTSIESINDGIQVYDGKTKITFEYPFPWSRFGSLLQGGLGLQFNNLQTQSALFFEANYKLSISRFHYTGRNNSNNLFIKDSNLSINVGYKF
ncbi:MAG: hypothetical protein HYU69_05135 [Bacteroidetes bacterium]|nr:hypothetical protein [Bacteroidota bacterium]